MTLKHLRNLTAPPLLKRLTTLLLFGGLGLASATDFNLSLTKSASATTVAANGNLSFTINVKNSGPYGATNVVIQDALPKGFKLVSASPAAVSTDASSDPKIVKYRFNLGSISAGASKSITIQATGVDAANISSPSIDSVYNYRNIAQVYSVDYASYDTSGSRPNNCTYTTIASGASREDDCAYVDVKVTSSTPPTPPVSGTCTTTSPYLQSFNTAGSLAEVRNHVYRTDPNVVTSTDGTYTLWNGIDNTGNGGYALYMNIANFAGNNGANLATPALLYESTINVPAGSTLNYQNYVRSHSNSNTQLRYVFTDTASGAVLKQYDGAVATTNYTQQSVPSFTASGSQVTLRIYTLKDGTSQDLNVLKLDDLKLTCSAPVSSTPSLTVSKSGNGPWTVGQADAAYTITVSNPSNVATSGTITVRDVLPAGISLEALSLPSGWTSSVSGQTLTLTTNNVLAAGGSATLSLPVTITSSAASSVTNKVAVGGGGDPDALPDPLTCTPGSSNPQNQCASYTTTISAPPTAQCSTMQALMVTSSGSVNGRVIRNLNENNTAGSTIATLPSDYYSTSTSATLAVSPDATRFYSVEDSTQRLLIYNTGTGRWTTGSTFSGVSGRMVRMAITPSGTGYAMDSTGNFWSFTLSGSTTYLGKLTSTSSGAPPFYDNGDFIATADGKLYLLSTQTSGVASLWFVDPVTRKAEFLGNLSNPTGVSQYGGLAAIGSGIYASTAGGVLARVDVQNLTLTQVGSTNSSVGSTDLTSCYYPSYAPKIDAVKTVQKVAGSAGAAVQPGDTLEYTITVRNSGSLPAGGVTFKDALPAGTTYVAGSAKVNGFSSTVTNGNTVDLSASAYPFTNSVGICSRSTTACTNQVLNIDSTPNSIDKEAVITFRVTVNEGVTSVRNVGIINYNDGNTPPTDIPTNPVETPVVTPVSPQLSISKTGNGPWNVGQDGANYTLTVSNTSTMNTSGTITVRDVLPTGITLGSLSLPSGWTSSASGQTVTLTTNNVLAAGASVSLTLPVSIGSAAAGSSTNKVAVGGGGDPDALPDPLTCTPGSSNPQNQCASYTTTISAPPTTQCTNLYALVITKTDYMNGVPVYYYGGKIQRLDELTNTLTGGVINLPTGATSATLAISPDGSQFFTADEDEYLRIYDTTTGTWRTGSQFVGVQERLVRMTMTPDGTGYAMDSYGNLWSFTRSGSTTSLGRLQSTSTTTPNFYQNGDFFATADGKLYMLSAQTGGTVNLWYVNPTTMKAEYLGNLTDASGNVQYNGLAATPNGVFAANSAGRLGEVDPINVTITPVGGTTTGSTDLASCYYPTYAPKVDAVKSVKKVAGSDGTDVRPGDTLEYSITVRNSGTLSAGGVTFKDALPAGTTYVPDSARINGFTTTTLGGTPIDLSGSAYPLTNSVGICSQSTTACTNQVLKVDKTPGTLDNEAVITFRVTVNEGVDSVRNIGIVNYNDGNTPPTDIPTNPVVTPVVPWPQLTITKTSNATPDATTPTNPGTWAAGQSGAAYTLTVKNASTVPTSGTITVKDLLPGGITAGNITPPTGWTCSVSAQLITCTTTDVLQPGASVNITVPVNVTGSVLGTLTNKAVVGGGSDPNPIPDPANCTPGTTNPANQCAAVPVNVTGAPTLNVIKTVAKVAGSTGTSVLPGDTLEYTITVRNTGNVDATGVTIEDALPAGTTYVPDSATINGFNTTVTGGSTTSLAGSTYPLSAPVGICSASSSACTTQTVKIDTTPGTLDNEAVIKFRVKIVDPFTLSPSQVSNQAIVKFPGGPDTPSDDPTTPTPGDPTVTPVVKPSKLTVVKTVQNITAGTAPGTTGIGKPGDVLEYCIVTTNVGSANATKITFGDTVPSNTTFRLSGYGAGRDIHVTTSTGADLYYTAALDGDAGALVNSSRVTVSDSTFVLQPQQSFTVCFRTTIK